MELPLPNEPCRLTKHTLKNIPIAGDLYTFAQPGRSMGRKRARISHEVVETWIPNRAQRLSET